MSHTILPLSGLSPASTRRHRLPRRVWRLRGSGRRILQEAAVGGVGTEGSGVMHLFAGLMDAKKEGTEV
jgi:hypothetical protein